MEYLKMRNYKRNCWLLFIGDITIYLVKKDKSKDDYVPVAFVRDGYLFFSPNTPKALKKDLTNSYDGSGWYRGCDYRLHADFEQELKEYILNYKEN